jgi:hypothetical protein
MQDLPEEGPDRCSCHRRSDVFFTLRQAADNPGAVEVTMGGYKDIEIGKDAAHGWGPKPDVRVNPMASWAQALEESAIDSERRRRAEEEETVEKRRRAAEEVEKRRQVDEEAEKRRRAVARPVEAPPLQHVHTILPPPAATVAVTTHAPVNLRRRRQLPRRVILAVAILAFVIGVYVAYPLLPLPTSPVRGTTPGEHTLEEVEKILVARGEDVVSRKDGSLRSLITRGSAAEAGVDFIQYNFDARRLVLTSIVIRTKHVPDARAAFSATSRELLWRSRVSHWGDSYRQFDMRGMRVGVTWQSDTLTVVYGARR